MRANLTMPLQNRVDPFGTIHAVPARGTMMGNRGGRMHDPATQTISRRYASRRWICCVREFKDRKLEVMGRGYTQLFFLDEVTAFAAGHRPCAECRRADFLRFTDGWRQAFGVTARRIADEMDAALHGERCVSGADALTISKEEVKQLPKGAMISSGSDAFAIVNGAARKWAFDGYSKPVALSSLLGEFRLLTPPSIVKVFRSGYRPAFHPSAEF
jgi:hypothetical protein